MTGLRRGGAGTGSARAPVFLIVAAAAALGLAPVAAATTYKPTKTNDNPAAGLTLREAISLANSHAGPDRIVLQPGKTYRLSRANVAGDDDLNTYGDLDVDDQADAGLGILSKGKGLATVDAQRIDRVFEPLSDVTFSRLRIRGGDAAGISDDGGGIGLGPGRVRLISSVLSGNRAEGYGGGIEVGGGGFFAFRSRISGNRADENGGGVYAEDGPTTVVKSSVTGNVADADEDGFGDSGGLENEDEMTIISSTISGNSTTGIEGGGGIRNRSGTLRLVNTTITRNRASHPNGVGGGGLAHDGAAVIMNAVTIARNSSGGDAGGFDYDAGTMEVRNSIIALNTAPDAPNCQGGAAVTSLGENLIGDNENCLFAAAPGDRVDRTAAQLKLGKFKRNGGPTKTIALRKGSAAIDRAGSDAPQRDQRGRRRNDRGGPDIGAFEFLR